MALICLQPRVVLLPLSTAALIAHHSAEHTQFALANVSS